MDHQVTDMKPEVDSSYAGGLKEIQGVPPIGLAQVIHSSGDITNVVHCINYRMFSLMEPFKNYYLHLEHSGDASLKTYLQGGTGRESRKRRTSRKFVEKARIGNQRLREEGASLRCRGEQTWSLSEGSLNSNESETGKSDDDDGEKSDEWREREQRRERLMGRLGPLFGRDRERSGLASLSKDDFRNKITKTDLRHRIKKQ